MTYRLVFTEDPADFLAAAGEHLAADPVLNTVVTSFTERCAASDAAGTARPEHPRWWVSVHDTGQSGEPVVGVAMRTAPFTPYPMYVLPMPDEAARMIAAALVGRSEDVTAANGALPAAQVLTEELAARAGGVAEVDQHQRLHVLGELVEPPLPPGRLRAATPADAELCLDWYRAFSDAAAQQAGRPHALNGAEHFDLAFVDARIETGCIWLWEDESGETVHLTAQNPPSYGVARVGPVYTPTEHRGRGYASAAVAAVSRQIRDGGADACLFTDQANPTSNKIYAAVGYRPVVDMVAMVITRPGLA